MFSINLFRHLTLFGYGFLLFTFSGVVVVVYGFDEDMIEGLYSIKQVNIIVNDGNHDNNMTNTATTTTTTTTLYNPPGENPDDEFIIRIFREDSNDPSSPYRISGELGDGNMFVADLVIEDTNEDGQDIIRVNEQLFVTNLQQPIPEDHALFESVVLQVVPAITSMTIMEDQIILGGPQGSIESTKKSASLVLTDQENRRSHSSRLDYDVSKWMYLLVSSVAVLKWIIL